MGKIMGNSKITPMTPLDSATKGGGKKPKQTSEKGPYSGPNAAPLGPSPTCK
jgi:hypothetical protein